VIVVRYINDPSRDQSIKELLLIVYVCLYVCMYLGEEGLVQGGKLELERGDFLLVLRIELGVLDLRKPS
jgi:hypothetical protein